MMDSWSCISKLWLVLMLVVNSNCSKSFLVFPKWMKANRLKRDSSTKEILHLNLGGLDEFFLTLHHNEKLVTSQGIVEWHYPNGTIETMPLKTALAKKTQHENNSSEDQSNLGSSNQECLFVGSVLGMKSSLAAIEVCDGYRGYIQVGTDGYILRPLLETINTEKDKDKYGKILNTSGMSIKKSDGPHILELVGDSITSLNVRDDFEDFSSMKFDDIDEENLFIDSDDNMTYTSEQDDNSIRITISSNYAGQSDERLRKHAKRSADRPKFDLDDYLASIDPELTKSKWEDHFTSDLWSSSLGSSNSKYASKRQRPFENTGKIVCQGNFCEYTKARKDEQKWLKIAMAVDSDVISFHGSHTVNRYVLTLLNIVSAIYGDPTLEANLKFVIVRLIFYEGEPDNPANGKQFNPIIDGNSKQSLENVNQWNDALWKSVPPDERHDAAIWLTRGNIGGPSGYAPVAGICDPTRSCSLNRDEGLSSAFIIAHELGHILGMSHDGDVGAGNYCKDEASQGSVMAPMVGATFSYFHWSPCSADEYHFKSSTWTCMLSYPHSPKNAKFIGNTIEYTYSLDDQCRMEFGKGFRFCRSFQLNDPCTHLWCSHHQTPDICKTKKGPPMDGTECGKGLWCVSGFCESMEKRRSSKDGLKHNPQAGGWSSWGQWGECSRSCGTGVQFRTRQCDNPRPAYGGSSCSGDSEEFRLCSMESCAAINDFRALQCKILYEVVSMDSLARDLQLSGLDGAQVGDSHQTWYPYEHDEPSFKCKLTCYSRDTGEYYQTFENVIDGTPCSYDDPSSICIQGKCLRLGCDKIVDSMVKEDICGVCGGDGSKCRLRSRTFGKSVSRIGSTKLMMIPTGARNIKISLKSKQGVRLSLKELNSNLVLVDGDELVRKNRSSFVTEGSKFNYTRKIHGSNFDEQVSARGPILGPIVVFAKSQAPDVTYDAVVNFTVSKVNEPMSTLQQYEWVMKGWSKCSKDCGEGRQHVVMVCLDKLSGRPIRKKMCGKRPAATGKMTRKCNDFGCDFSWLADRWEECSSTCGLNGIRIRQIYCVPNSTIIRANTTFENGENIWSNQVRPWEYMVNPKKCRGNKPPRIQDCNRIPCPAKWHPVRWSQCSSSCGEGVERQIFECLPPTESVDKIFFDCGIEPVVERPCNLGPCNQGCTEDESVICTEEVMKRYCVIPSYKKKCCKSCG